MKKKSSKPGRRKKVIVAWALFVAVVLAPLSSLLGNPFETAMAKAAEHGGWERQQAEMLEATHRSWLVGSSTSISVLVRTEQATLPVSATVRESVFWKDSVTCYSQGEEPTCTG